MNPDVQEVADRPRHAFDVALFRPQDADGIVELFRAVYGDGYPVKIFYDPDALTKANAEGDYYSIVARTTDGKIIGVHHLYRSAPSRLLYEWGAGLVLRDYRGAGISAAITRHMSDVVIPKLSLETVFGEAVCYHLHMQKLSALHRYIETALEIALMPGETYSKEMAASGRVATIMQFRSFRSKPHRVFLPAVYDQDLRFIYADLDDHREFACSEENLPSDAASQSEVTMFNFARVARIAVYEIGSDFEEHIEGMESKCSGNETVVFQVWLKLSSPFVGAAVEILRRKGYFLGGPLPRWFDEDGLLMQRVLCDPNFEAIQLYSDRSRKMLEIIRKDWERAQAE